MVEISRDELYVVDGGMFKYIGAGYGLIMGANLRRDAIQIIFPIITGIGYGLTGYGIGTIVDNILGYVIPKLVELSK